MKKKTPFHLQRLETGEQNRRDGFSESVQRLWQSRRQSQPRRSTTTTSTLQNLQTPHRHNLHLRHPLPHSHLHLRPHSPHPHRVIPPPDSPSESIRVICNVTRFPDSCISSITNSLPRNPTDPEAILKLSLRVSIDELKKLASWLSNSTGSALSDCKEQVDDSVSRLSESLSALEAAMTDAKIGDVRTWVSAAVTDQQTCIDGLEEMGSVDAEEVKKKMQSSMEYTSNSLAIVTNLKILLQKFHVPLH